MRLTMRAVLLSLALALCAPAAFAGQTAFVSPEMLGVQKGFKLRLPFDGAIMHTPSALLLYETAPGVKALVTRNEFKLDGVQTVPGNMNDLHHLRVELSEGRNTISWIESDTEKNMGTITVYYIPPYSIKRVHEKNAREFAFHQEEFEKRCSTCHAIPEKEETETGASTTVSGKVCSACHPHIDKVKKAHDPAESYDCFDCHDTGYEPSRFTTETSQAQLCGQCHDDFSLEDLAKEYKFLHGPVASGSCVVCHDPHGGQNAAFTREAVSDLCMHCHSDTVFFEVENSLHQDLDCTDCHRPHGAGNLALTYLDVGPLCVDECHDDPSEEFGGHPLAGHPVEAANDPSKPGRKMDCLSCHYIHGEADISQGDAMEDEKAQRKFCLKCHYS